MAEIENIEIYQEEVQEIMGQIPPWIIRWGISIIFLVILMLFSLCFWIEYPDFIKAEFQLDSKVAPVSVYSRNVGKIVSLKAQDQKEVEKGDLLAVIENPTSSESILKLKNQIATLIQKGAKAPIVSIENLGVLQGEYSELISSQSALQNYKELQPGNSKIKQLNREVSGIKQLQESLRRKVPMLRQKLQLAESDLNRYKLLLRQRSAAVIDVENKEREWVDSKIALEQLDLEYQQLEQQIRQKESEISSVSINDRQEGKESQRQFDSKLEKLEAKLADWSLDYEILAPIKGVVSMPKEIQEQQLLELNSELLTILPSENKGLIGRLKLKPQGAGKVEIGQKVLIRMDDYPHREFGLIEGTIKHLDLLPRDGFYSGEVEIEFPLITTYKKELPFRQKMIGTAEVVTENLRLIDRLFYQLRALSN